MAAKDAKGNEITTAADMGVGGVEIELPEVELTEKPAEVSELSEAQVEELGGTEDIVNIRPKTNVRVYFGTHYWNLVKGEVTPVPKGLKDYLHSHGALDIV